MFRFLFQFFALLLIFAVARAVITWILKNVAAQYRGGTSHAGDQQRGRPEVMTSGGELHRDPVCGTFVPGTSGFVRTVDGKTVYFCSADCRDEYSLTARR